MSLCGASYCCKVSLINNHNTNNNYYYSQLTTLLHICTNIREHNTLRLTQPYVVLLSIHNQGDWQEKDYIDIECLLTCIQVNWNHSCIIITINTSWNKHVHAYTSRINKCDLINFFIIIIGIDIKERNGT